MRTLVTLAAAILLYAGVALAQQTPPGPDTLGSYPGSVHSQPPPTAPTTNPEQNQQTTGTMGSTTGYNRNPDYAGSPPNPARGVQGQNPSTAPQTAPGQKAGKSKAKSGQSTANHKAKNHAKKGTARKHTPPAAGDSQRRWTEPSDDEPDAVTPLSKTLVLIKA